MPNEAKSWEEEWWHYVQQYPLFYIYIYIYIYAWLIYHVHIRGFHGHACPRLRIWLGEGGSMVSQGVSSQIDRADHVLPEALLSDVCQCYSQIVYNAASDMRLRS